MTFSLQKCLNDFNYEKSETKWIYSGHPLFSSACHCAEKKICKCGTYTDGLSHQTRLPATQTETPIVCQEEKQNQKTLTRQKSVSSAGVGPSLRTARVRVLVRTSSAVAVTARVPPRKIGSFFPPLFRRHSVHRPSPPPPPVAHPMLVVSAATFIIHLPERLSSLK